MKLRPLTKNRGEGAAVVICRVKPDMSEVLAVWLIYTRVGWDTEARTMKRRRVHCYTVVTMSPSKSTVTRSSLLGAILPDEMVWSYYARLIVRLYTLTFDGLAFLLGGELPSWSKSFPTRLSNLANAFNFAGAPDISALIQGHTFFPFAVPEITAGQAERLAATLADHPHPTGAPDHLVLPGSFKLRVCPVCMAEDEQKFGVTYWHRCHQLPLLRICCTHGTGLHETDVTAGIQDPVPVARAVVDLLPMEVDDAQLQRVLAEAYGTLARGGPIPCGSQVHDELERTLVRRGLYYNRQVPPILTNRLKFHFDQDALEMVGISNHEVGLTAWCLVPKLALIHFALGESFHDFLQRARGVAPADRWGARRDMAAEREHHMAQKVRLLAPNIAMRLRANAPRRISAWAIANELKKTLGAGFASNWSHRTLVREALGEAEEKEEEFHLRALERMRRNHTTLHSYSSLGACAGDYGLGQAIHRDAGVKEAVRHLYLSARAGAPE